MLYAMHLSSTPTGQPSSDHRYSQRHLLWTEGTAHVDASPVGSGQAPGGRGEGGGEGGRGSGGRDGGGEGGDRDGGSAVMASFWPYAQCCPTVQI